jgi:hypothetical protein
MVEIISKRGGALPADERLRALLNQNRSTIVRLADQLSQGRYSDSKLPKAAPSPQGLIIHVGNRTAAAAEPRPRVRASLNGRVIVVDDNSGRQLHHLGEIRRRGGEITFLLATKQNGFIAPAPDDLVAALDDLDRARLAPDGGEEALIEEIATRLGCG